jgi:signal transduction histidine kinase
VVRERFETYFQRVLQGSLRKTPEEMLDDYLRICMELSGANGGSILAEEGPHLQFLFSDVESLIGMRVPWDSIAGTTVRRNYVIFTYAPTDKRHFTGVDAHTARQTRYLLSIPIPSIHVTATASDQAKSAGALQLLFDENLFPQVDVASGAQEFSLESVREQPSYEDTLKEVFWILPNISFGMEVMRLRQTSYQVIHELKNKLVGTQAWLRCVEEDLGDEFPDALASEVIREDMELAESAASEGAELAKGYLQFTKLYTPQYKDVDVNRLLTQVAAGIRVFAAENGGPSLRVVADTDDAVGLRTMDPDQMKMAVFNLGKNAAEALIECGVAEPEVRLRSRCTDEGRLAITVDDNGPGMPEEIASNLFVAFKTKKQGGTGLGLTITKKIVDVHGGMIRCDTGSSGTAFTIEL